MFTYTINPALLNADEHLHIGAQYHQQAFKLFVIIDLISDNNNSKSKTLDAFSRILHTFQLQLEETKLTILENTIFTFNDIQNKDNLMKLRNRKYYIEIVEPHCCLHFQLDENFEHGYIQYPNMLNKKTTYKKLQTQTLLIHSQLQHLHTQHVCQYIQIRQNVSQSELRFVQKNVLYLINTMDF